MRMSRSTRNGMEPLAGATPTEQIKLAVQNGMSRAATPTNWEITQIHNAGRMSSVTLMNAGKVVKNPF
jgi:hypothetical protein